MAVAELLEDEEAINYTIVELPQGYELIDGELTEMPEMAFDSTLVAGQIYGELRDYFKTNPIGIAVPPEGSYRCFPHHAKQIRKPDVSVILADPKSFRWPGPHCLQVPALVVEVVSPHEKVDDLEDKLDDFLKAGTRLVWVIHPERRRAVVHYPNLTTRRINDGGDLTGEEVLPGLRIPLAAILPPAK